MEFKKERNIIFAYEGTVKLGGWNITTGEFIGKSGKPVKGTPACFTYQHLDYMNRNLLSGAVRMYREVWQNNNYGWHGVYTPERANRFEQMISLGVFPSNFRDLDSIVTLSKDLVAWIKENYGGQYVSDRVNAYMVVHTYASQLPNPIPDWIQHIIPDLVEEGIPSSFFIPVLKRAINEAWDYIQPTTYNRTSFYRNLISDYYKMSMQMWGKVNVEPNMLTHICKIRKLYKEYTDAHYDDILKANNDKPWLYFENDLLTARPLLTKAEFHAEAEAQHNCVESMYMERVKDGITHVVTIRYKLDPNHAYVTCEVDNAGRIVQYLTFGNHHVTDHGGLTFRDLYQTYILSHKE